MLRIFNYSGFGSSGLIVGSERISDFGETGRFEEIREDPERSEKI